MSYLEIAAEKPCVKVYYEQTLAHAQFCHLLYGIEEEGLPYELAARPHNDAVRLAYEACCDSRLAVGLGVSAEGMALHFDKLPPEQPLFLLPPQVAAEAMRALGANAARLVKKMPFKAL